MRRKDFKRRFTNKEIRHNYVIYANYGDDKKIGSYHCVKRGKYLSSKQADLGIKADVIIK